MEGAKQQEILEDQEAAVAVVQALMDPALAAQGPQAKEILEATEHLLAVAVAAAPEQTDKLDKHLPAELEA
jgi:hypothetical protein